MFETPFFSYREMRVATLSMRRVQFGVSRSSLKLSGSWFSTPHLGPESSSREAILPQALLQRALLGNLPNKILRGIDAKVLINGGEWVHVMIS